MSITLEVKNYGFVQAGTSSARCWIHIKSPQLLSLSEKEAVFSAWDEALNIKGLLVHCAPTELSYYEYGLKTRRDFSLLPVIIRKALQAEFDIEVYAPSILKEEGEFYGHPVALSKDPVLFWQFIAQAQMWFEK